MLAVIIRLVQQFVSRMDMSLEAANAIEVAVDDIFPIDDYVQLTVGTRARMGQKVEISRPIVSAIGLQLIATIGT